MKPARRRQLQVERHTKKRKIKRGEVKKSTNATYLAARRRKNQWW